MNRAILFFPILLLSTLSISQVVIQPRIGSKTHASMSIDSIILSEQATHCFIRVVNENTEGEAWFCADEDIVLVELKNNKTYSLVQSRGIPTCPKMHRFDLPGEELSFELIFPPIEDKMSDIDIIEQCSEHCFSLKGVVLDPQLNSEIELFEDGVILFQQKQYDRVLILFKQLSKSTYVEENHYAYSLYILPVIYLNLGDKRMARQSYERLKMANIQNKAYFLGKIRERPFFRSLD